MATRSPALKSRVKIIRQAEWIVSILLTLTVLILLIVRAQHAGGLWRDECASLQVAVMPTVGDLLENFQRETFPAFFYLVLRAATRIFGTSDTALRGFGLTVGFLLLVVVWINSRLLGKEPPLLSVSLLGLNTTLLIWGTTIRGYGIGSVFALLTFGLVAAVLHQPTRGRIAAALCAALASVQVLLHNSTLLTAIGLAAVIVCLLRRKVVTAFAVIGIGALCAASLLPYLGPFWNESNSTVVLQTSFDVALFWSKLQLALGNPNPIMAVVWITVFVLAVSGGAARLWWLRSEKPAPEWDLVLFGLLVAILSPISYFVFLKIVSYATREWYYLALLSILAGAIDLLVATLSRTNWIRGTRLVLAGVFLATLPFFAWPEVIKRQTNVDLIARKLQEAAQPNDLIVMNPWYYGVVFNWYYHGPTLWLSVPSMIDHRVHRFDLLKAKMMSPNALDDLYSSMRTTLSSGNRLWFVGGVWFLPEGESPPNLVPAPNPQFGWNLDPYSDMWSQQIGVFLRHHASGGQLIRVPTSGPVNPLENVDLLVVEGWAE